MRARISQSANGFCVFITNTVEQVVFLQKLIVNTFSQEITCIFMDPEGLLPRLQETAIDTFCDR